MELSDYSPQSHRLTALGNKMKIGASVLLGGRDEVLDAHRFYTLSEAQEAAEIWLEDRASTDPISPLGGCQPHPLNPRFESGNPLLLTCSLNRQF